MPITAIIRQPGSAIDPKIVAAYRPVIFRVKATRTDNNPVPPVVYCDIYFNEVFYKSIPATQYVQLNVADSEWQFDISDACQEYLKRDLPINGGSAIDNALNYIVKTFCRFRSSGFDANNFIEPEDVAPIQGTGTLAPTAGSGTESEDFMVINASLQHENNQDLLTHLQHSIANGVFDANAYPLSHRPSPYRICKGNSDYFPFLYLGNDAFLKICINYKLKGTDNFVEQCYNLPQTCDSEVSNVTAVLQENDDVVVAFDSTAPATDFEYKIDGGSWLIVPGNPFTIKFQQLLMYLITEAGEQIILDQNGNIIIPQDVQVYDVVHTVTIRPRCSNGVYGASGNQNFEVPSTPVCAPASLFDVNNINYVVPRKITFDITLPAGVNDFQLEWKFDYGNGFISPITTEDHTLVGATFDWNVPAGYPIEGGQFIFRIRTKCSATSFSQYSAELPVPFNVPLHNVNLSLIGITNDNLGNYNVHVQLSEAVSDDLMVRGYFQADRPGGFTGTYGFNIIIPAGQTDGFFNAPGAPAGGSAVAGSGKIEVASPNPTSGGQNIIIL
jgi:hypothetical protein